MNQLALDVEISSPKIPAVAPAIFDGTLWICDQGILRRHDHRHNTALHSAIEALELNLGDRLAGELYRRGWRAWDNPL